METNKKTNFNGLVKLPPFICNMLIDLQNKHASIPT